MNKKIAEIYNYRQITDLYETSGQPNKQQLKLIAQEGYQIVINLATNSVIEGSIINEKEILDNYKVKYIHLPVNFKNPTNWDFKKFVVNVQKYKNRKLWIHCAANMRVSAFTYKFRRDILNIEHEKIIHDMEAIWKPNKTWSSFLYLN